MSIAIYSENKNRRIFTFSKYYLHHEMKRGAKAGFTESRQRSRNQKRRRMKKIASVICVSIFMCQKQKRT